jgi:hypothetical protein
MLETDLKRIKRNELVLTDSWFTVAFFASLMMESWVLLTQTSLNG